jgi:hypothetical protein
LGTTRLNGPAGFQRICPLGQEPRKYDAFKKKQEAEADRDKSKDPPVPKSRDEGLASIGEPRKPQ